MPTLDSPPKLVFGALLILLITYSSALPTSYRIFADSLLGRVLGMALVLAIMETLGWVYGLLTAVAFLLVLHHAPRFQEGFESEKKTLGNRWFVERVLGRPSSIATEKVVTQAIHN